MLLPRALNTSQTPTRKRFGIHGRMTLGSTRKAIPKPKVGFLPHL